MKKSRIILTVIVFLITLLTVPLALIITAAAVPSKYEDSYYAELGDMYDKLVQTKGKKIVIIGNSSVAFGVNSSELEKMLKEDSGEEYTVCNFGLYGAIGTKTMLDLSKKHINKDDIVIIAPELAHQTMSLYFSAPELWRALDGNLKMVKEIKGDNLASVVGNFTGYVSEKYTLAHKDSGMASGIYAKASFDSNCDMVFGERDYNILTENYDVNNPVDIGDELLDGAFISYINDYFKTVSKKGASMYYSCCPVNKSAITCDDDAFYAFFDSLEQKIDFPILGNPRNYVMDWEWFYDTNFHLNNSGMYVRTVQLYKDIITNIFKKMPQYYPLPQKPERPKGEIVEGSNKDASCFVYEYDESKQGYLITGLSEGGKGKTELTIPTEYEGKPVVGYMQTAFKNNTTLKSLTVQENIKMLYDNSFEGCTSLQKLIIVQPDPNKISTGYSVLNGVEGCIIYVNADSYAKYIGHYTWSHLSKYIRPMEGGM